ncbi:MAG: sulfite exporter TauE/SafE family protein [Acidobacteriaceae bacterium]
MHLSSLYEYTWLAFAAFLAGIVNAVAGGGGFLAFPSLLHVGVLPVEANATNTVALWPGQFTSIFAYYQDVKTNLRLILPVMLAAFIGGIAGAWTLLHTSQKSFMHLVPWLFLMGATLFSISGPVSRWLRQRNASQDGSDKEIPVIPLVLCLTLVCFYIGYFGAGAGFITMTVLSLFGVARLAEVNALKVITTTTANGVAVVTFILDRAVVWQYCMVMMITCAIGGYLGAKYARGISDRILRPIIVIFGFTVAAYFFWKQA